MPLMHADDYWCVAFRRAEYLSLANTELTGVAACGTITLVVATNRTSVTTMQWNDREVTNWCWAQLDMLRLHLRLIDLGLRQCQRLVAGARRDQENH